ncbi:MAG: protein kinase domain-containing protein [Myxococcota bacterium]
MQVGDLVDGRFRLLELLGEGAAGKVFRAEDLARDSLFVALKLLHTKDPRWENFFRREFDVLSKLHHPNLVSVYDFGPAPEENTFYFAQELVIGKPLLDIVAGKKIDEVAGLFIEICRALEFIHGHGVLHRDLKPANILVQMHADPGERVRVLDFGLWRELDNTPQKGARWAGTPPYLASEVLRGYGHSISADLYAVGVTLFQAITRKLPHGRGTPQELLQARKSAAPDLSGVTARPIAELVARLLDEDPAQRPTTAAEVAAALAAVVPQNTQSLPITLGRARLVGREAEQTRLAEALVALRERRSGAPRLVLIEGDDGVGKSRLVGELKANVQLEGGRSAIGRCIEDARWSYRPIGELIRTLLPLGQREHLDDAQRGIVAMLCPETAERERERTNELHREEREQFHQDAAAIFLGLGRLQPCVLIVEDVTSCDAGSTALLAALLRRAKGAGVLVVLTAGPSALHGPVPRELLEAAGRDVLRLSVQPLEREDVGRLIAGLLGVAEVPVPVVDTVVAHSRGNPLLVEELVSLFIERGDLRRGQRGWLLDQFDSRVTAPTALLEVLTERIARLSESERRTLSALAVFNRPSGPKLLAAIGGVTRSDARQALSSAETHGLVRVVGEENGRPRVVFRHPQVREVLLDDLRRGGVLKTWHRTAAEVLEERAEERGGLDAIAETLAYHYEQAELALPALQWLLRAAEGAQARLAFDEVIQHARRAIRLLPRARASVDVVVKCDLLIGRAMLASGRLAEGSAFLENAVSRSDALKDPEGFAELHVCLGRVLHQLGSASNGQRLVSRATELLPLEASALARARLHLANGMLHQRLEPALATREAENALRLLPEPRAVGDELAAFEVLTVASSFAGERERTIRYAKHRVRLAERHSRPLEKITALRHLAAALGVTGQRLDARKHLNQALRLARDTEYRLEEALLLQSLGEQLYISGQYKEAIVRFQESAKLSAQLGQQADRAEALMFLGACYLAKGEYERSIDHLKSALEAFERLDHVANLVSCRSLMANAHLGKRQLDEAEKILRAAAKRLPAEGFAAARADVYLAQGNLFSTRGDHKRARIAYLHATALSRSVGDLVRLGEGLIGYGALLLRMEHPRRALRLARRAHNLFVSLDARGHMKRTLPLLNAAEGLATLGTPPPVRKTRAHQTS